MNAREKYVKLTQAVLFASLIIAGESAMSLEKPKYEVLDMEGDIEYRQYEPYLVAETVIETGEDYKSAGNEGFRRLFRYISGGNQAQTKIAMTAPVQQAPEGEKIAMTALVQQTGDTDGWRIAFMLPAKYTLENAPRPTDSRVQIRAVPGRLFAVLRYSGRWTERNFTTRSTELLKAIDAERIEPLGEIRSAFYNPPFTPPFMRRNEVMVAVDRLPASAAVAAADIATAGQATY
jgi:hypothetical protein